MTLYVLQVKLSKVPQYLFSHCKKTNNQNNFLSAENSGQIIISAYLWKDIQISLMWRLVALPLTVSRTKMKGICLTEA